MNKIDFAYIAGFLDGDGSVRIQFQPRKNAKFGFRIRAQISFAQKIGSKEHLEWIRKKLGIGYIYTRSDGMNELKIEGFNQVRTILKFLSPFIHFKRLQVDLMILALDILNKNSQLKLKDFIKIAEISDRISRKNYLTRQKKYTAEFIKNFLFKKYPRND